MVIAMNYKVFIITLVLGYMGTIIIGNMLNIPDAGSILSIAFIGSHIIKRIDDEKEGLD